MTVNPITLDLRDFNQAMSSNIANMQAIPCINVNVSLPANICSWIISIGGWNQLIISDIMELVNGYLVGPSYLEFEVTFDYIMGSVAYYIGNVTDGNGLTGCTFVIQ